MKNSKKIISALVAFALCLSASACGTTSPRVSTTSATTKASTTAKPTTTTEYLYDLDESDIERYVKSALRSEIESEFPKADAGSCRCYLNTTEKKGKYIYAYGTVSLYDKYGEFLDRHNFTVEINRKNLEKSCEID